MERKQMAESISGVATEIRRTAGVSEPDVFRHCMYGDIARLVCRDLPRLSASLSGESKEDASAVLRDVGASVEANRNTFAWLAPTLSSDAQSIMKPGGGPILGQAMDLVSKDAGVRRDDMLSARPGIADEVMFNLARQAVAMGRGREY